MHPAAAAAFASLLKPYESHRVMPDVGKKADQLDFIRGERRDVPRSRPSPFFIHQPSFRFPMHDLILSLPPVAAIGYSLLYMLFGGGFLGAIVIFVIAKIFGR
jgi:hypothetical protein